MSALSKWKSSTAEPGVIASSESARSCISRSSVAIPPRRQGRRSTTQYTAPVAPTRSRFSSSPEPATAYTTRIKRLASSVEIRPQGGMLGVGGGARTNECNAS